MSKTTRPAYAGRRTPSPISPALRQPAKAPFRTAELLEIARDDKGSIWSHVRQRWLVETPEERVRQEYLCLLVNEYGFGLDQINEEVSVTGSGSGQARADFVVWRTVQDCRDSARARRR